MSLGGVARRAGISTSTLSRWESGKTRPGVTELEATLGALGAGENEYREAMREVGAPRALRRLRQKAGAALPVSGDLLRALRLRRGWTQTETARAVDVTQGQIAQWEHSDAWPDAARLHTLCWALEARPEEIEALTCGRFRQGWIAVDSDVFQIESPRAFDEWNFVIQSALLHHEPELTDLTFLSLEAQLGSLLGRYSFAQPLLALAYAHHARCHMYYLHPERGGEWAHRSLALVAAQPDIQARLPLGKSPDWGSAPMVAASAAASGGSPIHLRRAIKVLETWLPALQRFDMRAWALSDMASYQARLGNVHAAMHSSKTAVSVTQGDDQPYEVENIHRLRDHARLLTDLGNFAEALETLAKSDRLTSRNGDRFVRDRLLEVECFLGLGVPSAASASLHRAQARLEQDELHYLSPLLSPFSARL